MEMYSVARHQLGFYHSVVSYLRFRIPSFSLVDWQPRLEAALRATIEAQPRLRLQVDLSRKEPVYVVLPTDAFETLPVQIVERIDDDDDAEEEFLERVLTDETNRGFRQNSRALLWRVVLIVSSNGEIVDLLFTYSHAIGDGMSGMAFFTTLLRCLSGKDTPTFPLTNDRPANELLPHKLPSASSVASQVIENLLLPSFARPYFFPKTFWAGNTPLKGNEPIRTRLVSFALPAAALASLHGNCRRERTTIHTALMSSLLLSLAETFAQKDLELQCSTAVNTRRFCHPVVANEQIGVFVSSASSRHFLPRREQLVDLFWPLARQIKEQIDGEIEHGIIPLVQMLKFVSDWSALLVRQRQTLPNGHQNSVEISNILRWTFDTTGQAWSIVHGGFVQSANIIGAAFLASVVTVNDILKVYISFQEHSFPDVERVNVMKHRMREMLLVAST